MSLVYPKLVDYNREYILTNINSVGLVRMLQHQITLPVGAIVRDTDRDRYAIEGLLGIGGFGAVYLVRNKHNKDELFALKEVIDPNKLDHERFIFEGEVLKRLHHRALPRIYRVFENEKLNRVYIL